MAQYVDQNVLIPVKLDAFVFNAAVCDGGVGANDANGDDDPQEPEKPVRSKIAPITQPNYSFLRLDASYLQADILQEVDLHNSAPATSNPRLTNLNTGQERVTRKGVYLHWTIPRAYRSGSAVTKDPNSDASSPTGGLPTFPEVPTRWLVIRHIHDRASVQPRAASDALPPVTAWIVESDRCRTLDGDRDAKGNLKDPLNVVPENLDLQVDVSPFVSASETAVDLRKQAEIFIGDKTNALDWHETVCEEKGGLSGDKTRVPLTLLGSSNELFPDYQPHCSNVFSVVDNFGYALDPKTKMPTKFATQATASYTVLGWHSTAATDLLRPSSSSGAGNATPGPRRALLKRLGMELKGYDKVKRPDDQPPPAEIEDWLDAPSEAAARTRSLCHGAMYDVHWDVGKAPAHVLADKFASMLAKKLPVAVGTTPLDALMTYAGAHENIDKGDPQQIEKALRRIETRLLARDDGVDAQMQAADMLYNWNYARLDGGDQYHVAAGSNGDRPTPSPERQKQLIELNQRCRLLDAATRKLKRQRWAVFSEWWQRVTEAKTDKETAAALKPIVDSIDALVGQRDTYKPVMAQATLDGEFLPGVHAPFYQPRDPTLLVGGVRSGWEPDYLCPLAVRIDGQLAEKAKAALPHEKEEGWDPLINDVLGTRLPEPLRASAKGLVREFVLLRTERKEDNKNEDRNKCGSTTDGGGDDDDDDASKKAKPELPVFHDRLGLDYDGKPAWRDSWNDTQPWFPLYLEWEVEYTHINYSSWELSESKPWHGEAAKLHYGIPPGVKLAETYAGDKGAPHRRRFSGRVLILPQPSFSLEAKIKQLIADTLPSELADVLPEPHRTTLETNLHKLEFLSAPLSGFSSHLLTVEQGNHIKPSIRNPATGSLYFFEKAARKEAGLDLEKTLPKMEIETDLTPYGNRKRAPLAGKPASFKPVAHGQFRITKLNIIDKFGQAIHALDPAPAVEPPRLWPCISDWYAPQAKAKDEATEAAEKDTELPNVVGPWQPEHAQGLCEFIQVPPQINQPARLNAVFAMPPEEQPTAGTPFWRAAHDWDEPIWGWVVINYANFGLQFFLASGAFYREVRMAGPDGAQGSDEWLPFDKPDSPDQRSESAAAKQLARLVQTLAGDGAYLRAFVDTITTATATQAPTPSAYAEFRSALVGRPLALVHTGWSLELAGPPMTTQLAQDDRANPERWLVPPDKTTPPDEVYTFPMRLGDDERGFDGLVGYFLPKPKADLAPGDALQLSKMYSHFAPGSKPPAPSKGTKPKPMDDNNTPKQGVVPIRKQDYPLLSAYHISPDTLDPVSYDTRTNAELHVFGALVDPFLPCHAYTGILPVKELALPAWTWQASIDRLSAFFHAGPLLVTDDVPGFEPTRRLKEGHLPPKVVDRGPKGDAKGVALPGGAGALGQWTWLQPYFVQKKKPGNDGGKMEEEVEEEEEEKGETKFMPLGVDYAEDAAKLPKGPYTALEGYLQMAAAPSEKEKKEKPKPGE